MKKAIRLLTFVAIGLSTQQAQAITIEFNYDFDSSNFFSDQEKNTLNAAGTFFENRLTDSLTAITSIGTNHFSARFNRPDETPSTDINNPNTTINDFSVISDTLIVYVGGRNIGGSTLGVGGPGGFSASSSSQAFFDNIETRGQGERNQDFGPWGGVISFDTNSAWYFDSDISTVADLPGNKNDFYSVALHELGHVLGIGTSQTWNSQYADFHLAEGTMSLVDGLSQEAAMDPTIITGTRKHFTDLDLAALSDIGWEVSAVPVPAAVYLFGSALLGLGAFRKKVK